MKYLSVCSGIEAATVAWHGLGWQPVGFSEIEPFPCAVLAHHCPGVTNYGDMTRHETWPIAPGSVDLIVGGTPCQSFSVAGLRQGLADPRGNLTLTYLALVARVRPRWVVWENVPGVLSDRTGAFGTFLGGLAELGYGWAYRIMDAQYFGVPQRRRRVFVVGHSGGCWQRAAAVLFEPESLRGDTPARRPAREGVAPTISARTHGGGGLGTDAECGGAVIPVLANTMTRRMGKGINTTCDEGQTLIPQAWTPAHLRNRDNMEMTETVPCLTSQTKRGDTSPHVAQPMAFQPRIARNGRGDMGDMVNTLQAQSGGTGKGDAAPCVATSAAVRRLTPRECERLQGFPDDYTLIPYRGKPASDGPRYKALGNSMAVPVMAWIGQRIQQVEEVTP